ncbi:MAG TPA: GNAT family N-acetyltransferase [Streptosporangiaceae bacterium]|nr:GNAT family N-acetyltransferase [Streptosporangiaceae bacterium]
MIRSARPADIPVIRRLIRELADYEGALAEVQVTDEDLAATLFSPQPAVFAHVAEHEGAVVGFALWFLNYSTWTGRHGIYLEDLYVIPALRRSGLGRALLAELAGICVRRGYARLEWAVLDWNSPALAFYAALGAANISQWATHRLTGDALRALAATSPGPGPDERQQPGSRYLP